MKGKRVCKTHGGRSTGPRTEEGHAKCAAAKTIHGNESRKARSERSLGSARLAVLESVGVALNMFTGSRTAGPKPTRMAEVYPELQELFRVLKFTTTWIVWAKHCVGQQGGPKWKTGGGGGGGSARAEFWKGMPPDLH